VGRLIGLEALAGALLMILPSFSGILFFYLRERTVERAMVSLGSFAAGMLIGVAFLLALPRALEETGLVMGGSGFVFSLSLMGVVACFLLERIFHWRHLHERISEVLPLTSLNALGDALHYFLVGVGLAAAFHFSIGGWLTAAFFVHALPQELSDSAQLLHAGHGKSGMLRMNLATALFAAVGVVTASFLFGLELTAPYLLAFTAGFMTYAGIVDITPVSRAEISGERSLVQLALFIGAIVLIQLVQVLG
jgi:zinc transporter ZupT